MCSTFVLLSNLRQHALYSFIIIKSNFFNLLIIVFLYFISHVAFEYLEILLFIRVSSNILESHNPH